jgi:hypothetical protein
MGAATSSQVISGYSSVMAVLKFVDAKTKESTRKTEEKLDGRNKEGHARKKPK